MKLFGAFHTMFDPDGGGGGDPDAGGGDPGGGGDPARAAKADNAVDLKAIADSIRLGFAGAAEASRPAPLPVAPVNNDAVQRALEAEATTIDARVNELAAAGDIAGAMAIREQFARKANALLAPSAADNPIIKTAVALGERVARTEHAAIMGRWGDEVRRKVDAMAPEQRVLPDAWDTAVAAVRANHFTELMEETVTARVTEERAKFVPPPSAPGSRGRQPLVGAAAKLSEEQLWGADICGVAPEDYAREMAREEKYDALPFKERAKFPGYPICDDPRGNAIVKPGSF